MTKPIITIHNTETNEIVQREMSDAEYAEHLKSFETKPLSVEEAKAAADKAALLAKLGITAEEATLLLS